MLAAMDDTTRIQTADADFDESYDSFTDDELLVEEISIDGMCGVY